MGLVQNASGFRLTEPGQPVEPCALPPLEPAAGEVVVEVAGCGVCHTDIGFAAGDVRTRHPLPLVLGHEIAGRVVEAGDGAAEWLGRAVIVPAVIPCGECAACRAGRSGICRRQFMPGNDGDGGFATHVKVPARGLCPVPEPLPDGLRLADLSVIADAVTTPYEAIRRSGLSADDVAVFVGVGGIGGFGVQIAAAMGAAVAAIDVDPERLELAAGYGAGRILSPRELDPKELKKAVRGFAQDSAKPGIGLKIFETSGTPQGQLTAFSLLDFGAHLAVVGFTPQKVEVRLSNLMAFDASAEGNWGCPPERYPEALALVLDGKVRLGPFVERFPLEEAPRVLAAVAAHEIKRRPVLIPGAHPQETQS